MQERRLRTIILVVVMIMPMGLLMPHAATENVYYVSPDGDDANLGSFDLPWRTIQHAVDNVKRGFGNSLRAVQNGVALSFSASRAKITCEDH